MAQSPVSLLILKRLKPTTFSLYNLAKPFSTSSPNPSNLSARMSFVFEQIDVIEKERSQKDQTLERIRAWRESKTAQSSQPEPTQVSDSGVDDRGDGSLDFESGSVSVSNGPRRGAVEMVHPWPEWIELMERLVQQNYFDLKREDEGKMVEELGFDVGVDGVKPEEAVVESEFLRDYKTVQAACVNFGKDRFDILRSLSRQDIRLLVGYGCPSADKRVVLSSKLLRKHVHLDEGDVCSSCNLRNSCEKAYLLTNKEDDARTIDIMRVLLAYGFDHINGFVTNKSVLKQKSVKTVVRKLLHEVVKLGAVPIDPNLPPPVIKKPPPKVKQPPPPPRKRVGRDDIEMKKGDWHCPKCDFMNFAKNTVCLQCDAKRPKRQLLPGEWECPECSFLNYRRNMSCFHCQCKRPPDEFMESKMQERQTSSRTRPEKVVSRTEISNAWNFNFDDDESDGADVAAFEYADSSVKSEDSFDNRARNGNLRGNEDDFGKAGRYPDYDRSGSRIGFNDFDDGDDDIDSYELDTQDKSSFQRTSYKFAQPDDLSDTEDSVPSGNKFAARRRSTSQSDSKPFKSRKAASPGTDDDFDSDSDVELSVHPKRKSGHAADFRPSRGRGPGRPSKKMSFESDEDFGFYSDEDDDLNGDFNSVRSKARQRGNDRRDYQRLKNYGSEDDSFSDSEFGRNKRHSQRSRQGGHAGRPSRWESSGNNQRLRSNKLDVEDDDFESRNRRGGNKVDRISRWESSGNNQGRSFKKHDMDDNDFGFRNRRGGSKTGRSPRWEPSGNNQCRSSNKFDVKDDGYEFKNRNRVIER